MSDMESSDGRPRDLCKRSVVLNNIVSGVLAIVSGVLISWISAELNSNATGELGVKSLWSTWQLNLRVAGQVAHWGAEQKSLWRADQLNFRVLSGGWGELRQEMGWSRTSWQATWLNVNSMWQDPYLTRPRFLMGRGHRSLALQKGES